MFIWKTGIRERLTSYIVLHDRNIGRRVSANRQKSFGGIVAEEFR
jgi:hypothetical protein